jgi:adenine phosphoribosyltransferase
VPAHDLARWVREIPDFPKPGINFRDITPLLADPGGFAACMEALAAPWRAHDIDVVCGIESRGFVFGAALAQMLGAGFVPLRKGGNCRRRRSASIISSNTAWTALKRMPTPYRPVPAP